MFATPRNYIAGILAGENQRRGAGGMATARSGWRRGAALGPARSDADLAAVAWACEMTALEGAADAMPERKRSGLDFDRSARRHGRALVA